MPSLITQQFVKQIQSLERYLHKYKVVSTLFFSSACLAQEPHANTSLWQIVTQLMMRTASIHPTPFTFRQGIAKVCQLQAENQMVLKRLLTQVSGRVVYMRLDCVVDAQGWGSMGHNKGRMTANCDIVECQDGSQSRLMSQGGSGEWDRPLWACWVKRRGDGQCEARVGQMVTSNDGVDVQGEVDSSYTLNFFFLCLVNPICVEQN